MCPIEIPILEKTVQRTQGWLQDLSRLMGWSESVFFLLGERVVEGEIEFVKQVLHRSVASFWPNG